MLQVVRGRHGCAWRVSRVTMAGLMFLASTLVILLNMLATSGQSVTQSIVSCVLKLLNANIQGVPYYWAHFVFVIISGSRAHTEELFIAIG